MRAGAVGLLLLWREVGRRMNIRDIPVSYDVFERFNKDYEREHYRFTKPIGEWARQPANCSLVGSHGFWRRWCGQRSMRCWTIGLLSFGFPQPSRLMRRLVPGALRLRAGFVRLLPPPRNRGCVLKWDIPRILKGM